MSTMSDDEWSCHETYLHDINSSHEQRRLQGFRFNRFMFRLSRKTMPFVSVIPAVQGSFVRAPCSDCHLFQ